MDLLSSLLVWRHGQLVPASSASSPPLCDVAVEPNAATAQDAEELRPQTPKSKVAVNPPKSLAHASGDHEILATSSRAKTKRSTTRPPPVKTEITSSSLPLPNATPLSKSNENRDQAYLLSAGDTTRPPQAHPLENMSPPSAQLACADVDMLPAGSHDLGLTDPSDLLEQDDLLEDELQYRSLVGLEGMEEYEKANPFTPPPPKAIPRRLSKNNGVHSSTFWMACQDRGLKTEFNFREREQGCFYLSLKVNGQDLDEVGPYASKKDAKEAICEKNLGNLEAFGNRKKRKSSGERQEVLSSTPEGFENENWVGVLHRYLQTKQLPFPEYDLSGLHPSMGPWLCTVRFQGSPLTPFGYGIGPFARKDEAKKVAAMEAVNWLRKEGKLDETVNKQRKSGTSLAALARAPGDTGLTQSLQRFQVRAEDSPPHILTTKSMARQVHDAVLRLALTGQPAFPTKQLEGAFLDMWAVFHPNDARKDPRLAGEVCRVGPVYGKKTAKEECCRELLRLLAKIEQSRQTLI